LNDIFHWYRETFTLKERQLIARAYRPMAVGLGSDATRSNPIDQPPTQQLWNLVGWLKGDSGPSIALRLTDGALQFATETLDRHFALQAAIQLHYRLRANPDHLEAAEKFCRAQVAMAPEAARVFRAEFAGEGRDSDFMPSHVGFKQLAIILEKRGDLSEAIALCELATAQGWRGDWAARIERLEKKLADRPDQA
jgi:hypothetical protein